MLDERRSHTFLWIAAGLLVLAVGYRLLADRAPRPPPVAVEEQAPDSAGSRSARAERAYVHVAGAVRRPGLYRVRPGARIATALERAGGTTRKADVTTVNLAARVRDGHQVVVPVRGGAPAVAAAPAAPAAGSPISLATATQAQLEEVDGIGPTLAQAIIEYRDAHGGFRSLEELQEVDGIGEKRFEALREAVQP